MASEPDRSKSLNVTLMLRFKSFGTNGLESA
jgi:hypothetical protein